ncbi:sensor histidine kinase [Brevibacillus daliensis]|uniref:sensor histidine kinase n=1 Tax=Brevibacillus daliensis TaxID=2892995 RepID=UPI001E5667EC|nr:sensor histidine kinase [Brevibacillus daliensis]
MEEQIRHLCRLHTDLSTSDITRIIEVAESIECSSEVDDIFIDVLSKYASEAIVVYHRRPSNGKSLYKRSVVSEKALRENEPGALRTLETGIMSQGLIANTQENHLVRQSTYPILNNDKVICVVIYERKVNEEIQSDFNVTIPSLQSEEIPSSLTAALGFNEKVINQLDDAILIFDKDGFVKLKNKKADIYYQRLGYLEDIQGLHYDNLSLDRTTFLQVMREESDFPNGQKGKETQMGDRFYKVKRLYVRERGLRLVVILQDMTEIKMKEAEIVSKSVVIREIHHRVKNNLQTVASLLRIQSRQVESPEAKKSLNDSVSRVLAIAATHELLSMEVEAQVNLLEVIHIIATNIQRCFVNCNNVQVEMKTNHPICLDSDRTVAIALIVNELMQNCYEHAFGDCMEGKIVVSLLLENGYVTLKVMDDGKGFSVKNTTRKSLGMSIVHSYVKDKLKGKFDIESSSNGTTARFTFKM